MFQRDGIKYFEENKAKVKIKLRLLRSEYEYFIDFSVNFCGF